MFLLNMGEESRIAEISLTTGAAKIPLASGTQFALAMCVDNFLFTHPRNRYKINFC